MSDTDVDVDPGVQDLDPLSTQLEVAATENGGFTVGPPDPVTDSRLFPVVTPEEEAAFVSGDDDQDPMEDDQAPGAELPDEAPPDDPDAGDPFPDDDELAALIGDVDVDDVDDIGFDETDTVDAGRLAGLTDPGGA